MINCKTSFRFFLYKSDNEMSQMDVALLWCLIPMTKILQKKSFAHFNNFSIKNIIFASFPSPTLSMNSKNSSRLMKMNVKIWMKITFRMSSLQFIHVWVFTYKYHVYINLYRTSKPKPNSPFWCITNLMHLSDYLVVFT